MCAGEGRDVLPVLAARAAAPPVEATGDDGVPDELVRAVLIELEPAIAERARATAAELRLPDVTVITADAGSIDTYRQVEAAHILLACGVFGNITVADMRRTVGALPALLADDGIVIWTRGRPDTGPDPALDVLLCFADHGFEEMSFVCPTDSWFRVGMHRLRGTGERPRLAPGGRLFTFV
jgi:hypothetical protein